jgi:hypothetical protein
MTATRRKKQPIPVHEPAVVAEIVGRTVSPYSRLSRTASTTSVDWTRPDYAFWSRVRRGKEPGYELGGLFAKRIAEIDAEWTLGRGFTLLTNNPDLDAEFARWVRDNLNTLMTWRKDASALGDAYLIVNGDGSLSAASAEQVDVLTDPLDYKNVLGYRITSVLDAATITDEFRVDGRTITIEAQGQKQEWQYSNPLGLLPVVHLPNDREANEIYGHPIYEALLRLFARYDDVLQKSLDGVEVMGRPIPVAEGLEDVTTAQAQNSSRTETVYNEDGTTASVPVVDFEDMTMLWLGKGASFKFAGPGSFSADSVAMLQILFYLMLEHIGIPEWAWGGAISSSKASVDAQMPAFVRYLEGRRTQVQEAILKLAQAWLAVKRLTTALAAVDVSIEWPALEGKDQAQHTAKVKLATDNGWVTDETGLRLLELVDDPAAEVEAAKAAAQTDESRMQAEIDAQLSAMRMQSALDENAMDTEEPDQGEGIADG